ncbi:MAG TPA: hypothetical protein VJU82_15095 [Acidobacteriaceae bacterium]|nr:hypothetical protein [Acidobacteriaceae bacterium]
MTDLDIQEFWRHFEREARRLRLNMIRLPGVVATGADWQGPLLDRMRALEPGSTWQDVFAGVQIPEPDPRLAGGIATFDADPDAWWREHEIGQDITREFRRLVPFPRQQGSSDDEVYGWDLPEDAEHALGRLRSLPDSAGWNAFRDALHRKRPKE